MKLAITAAALAATAALALPATSLARAPELRMPDFSHLRSKASETVDVNVGGFLLGLARAFTSKEDRENDRDLRILDDIKAVKVRSYKFDSDDAYTKADVEAVRSQLKGPEWNALVNVHKRDGQEDVDVFVCVEDNKTCGIAVIATEPREFTVVSIVGSIDIDRLAELEGEFGIPKVNADQSDKGQ